MNDTKGLVMSDFGKMDACQRDVKQAIKLIREARKIIHANCRGLDSGWLQRSADFIKAHASHPHHPPMN